MRVQSQEIAWIVSQDRSLNKCNTIDAILRKDVHKNLKAIVVGVGRVSVLIVMVVRVAIPPIMRVI